MLSLEDLQILLLVGCCGQALEWAYPVAWGIVDFPPFRTICGLRAQLGAGRPWCGAWASGVEKGLGSLILCGLLQVVLGVEPGWPCALFGQVGLKGWGGGCCMLRCALGFF